MTHKKVPQIKEKFGNLECSAASSAIGFIFNKFTLTIYIYIEHTANPVSVRPATFGR